MCVCWGGVSTRSEGCKCAQKGCAWVWGGRRGRGAQKKGGEKGGKNALVACILRAAQDLSAALKGRGVTHAAATKLYHPTKASSR